METFFYFIWILSGVKYNITVSNKSSKSEELDNSDHDKQAGGFHGHAEMQNQMKEKK